MVFYFVQKGETLYAIARRYQTTVHAIVTANRLEDPNAICPGQALLIPRPGEVPSPPPGGIVHLVRPGETVFHLASRFGTPAHDILRANQIAHPEFIMPGQQLVIPEPAEAGEDWPMLGRTPGRTGAGPVVLEGPPLEGWRYSPRRGAGVKPSAPIVRYDRVFVGLGDGQYYSLDRYTGRLKWRVPTGAATDPSLLGGAPMATPLVYDGLAYLCDPEGAVLAVEAYSGRSVWRVTLGGPIVSSPAASDGVVYLGGGDGHVYALEAKTGAIVWKQVVGGAVRLPVAVGEERVYAVDGDATLWALNAESGEVCWQAPLAVPTPPVFAEVVILAGDRAYDPKSGQVLWEAWAPGRAAVDGSIAEGEPGTEGPEATLGTAEAAPANGEAVALRISPIARLDQLIYPGGVVDLFSGNLLRSDGPPGVSLEAHVASGVHVLGVGTDGRLYAWDAQDGSLVWARSLPASSVQPPAIASGQVVLSLVDGSVCTFRFQTEESV